MSAQLGSAALPFQLGDSGGGSASFSLTPSSASATGTLVLVATGINTTWGSGTNPFSIVSGQASGIANYSWTSTTLSSFEITVNVLLGTNIVIADANSGTTFTISTTRAAQNYYVANSGSDAATGLSGAAWASIAKVLSWGLIAGDKLRFVAGETYTGALDELVVVGTAGAGYIYIGTVGRDLPANVDDPTTWAAGSNPAIISCGDNNGIKLLNSKYYFVDNLKPSGSGVNSGTGVTTSTGCGVSLKSTQASTRLPGARLNAIEVIGCRDGIFAWVPETTQFGWDNLLIANCKTHANQRLGILMICYNLDDDSGPFAQGDETQNIDCHFTRNQIYDHYGKLDEACGSGIDMRNCTDSLADFNVIRDHNILGSWADFAGGTAGMGTACSLRTVYRDNEIYNVYGPIDVDGVGLNAESGACDWIFERNYVHDCEGAGILVGRVTGSGATTGGISRNNIYARNASLVGQGEISVFNQDGGSLAFTSHNDTVYASHSDCVQLGTVVGTFKFYNDIFVSEAGAKIFLGTPDAAEGNLYWAVGGGNLDIDGSTGAPATAIAAWRARGFESQGGTNGKAEDPLLLSPTSGIGTGVLPGAEVSTITYFDIPSGSPARDAGENLLVAPYSLGSVGLDFHGNARLAGSFYDIGSVEYTVTASALTFSGPSSGNYKTASSAFTIGANGPVTSLTVATPTDSSGAGYYTPSSVNIQPGNSTADSTVTYTPTTAGARNLNVTSSPSLTSPADHPYTSNAVVPYTPSAPSAEAGDSEATVDFSAPDNGGSAILGYAVASSPADGTDTDAGTTDLEHLITALVNGTPYTFRVIATNAIGSSSPSAPSNSVTPQAAPADSVATVSTVAGTTLACSVGMPESYDPNGYADLEYTMIGEITDLGYGYGRVYSTTTRAPIDSPQVTQRKSHYSQPPIDYMMAWSQSDEGQDLLRTAATDDSVLSFKLTLQGGDIRYFTAQVSRMAENHGSVNELRQGALTLLMQRDIVAFPP